MCSNKGGITYRDAGVDIDAGNKAVRTYESGGKTYVYYRGVVRVISAVLAVYSRWPAFDMKEPMLVSGTDGVGTKLRLAIMMDKHDTIGQDCVAMSVNDILVQGATPLFFLDYIAVGKLIPEQVATIVRGVAEACEESGCALLGGETAEMAGFYGDGDYDVAGFAMGIVDKPRLLTGENIKAGDVLLGLPSSGVHSNGFSLVRKIVFDHKNMSLQDEIPEFGKTLGEELLTPTRLYPKAVLPSIRKGLLKGMVHVTGGGFYDNIPRILPEKCDAEINAAAWEIPVVFKKVAGVGQCALGRNVPYVQYGVGMVLVVAPGKADAVRSHLTSVGEPFYELGNVVAGNKKAIMKGGVFSE